MLSLEWSNITYSINKNEYLIDDQNGEIKSGELVAIMGSTGAGKSTLLNILAGRIGRGDLSGKILINGESRNPNTWRNIVAYVEQTDLMYANLTVEETLHYATRLKLNLSYSKRCELVSNLLNINVY